MNLFLFLRPLTPLTDCQILERPLAYKSFLKASYYLFLSDHKDRKEQSCNLIILFSPTLPPPPVLASQVNPAGSIRRRLGRETDAAAAYMTLCDAIPHTIFTYQYKDFQLFNILPYQKDVHETFIKYFQVLAILSFLTIRQTGSRHGKVK